MDPPWRGICARRACTWESSDACAVRTGEPSSAKPVGIALRTYGPKQIRMESVNRSRMLRTNSAVSVCASSVFHCCPTDATQAIIAGSLVLRESECRAFGPRGRAGAWRLS